MSKQEILWQAEFGLLEDLFDLVVENLEFNERLVEFMFVTPFDEVKEHCQYQRSYLVKLLACLQNRIFCKSAAEAGWLDGILARMMFHIRTKNLSRNIPISKWSYVSILVLEIVFRVITGPEELILGDLDNQRRFSQRLDKVLGLIGDDTQYRSQFSKILNEYESEMLSVKRKSHRVPSSVKCACIPRGYYEGLRNHMQRFFIVLAEWDASHERSRIARCLAHTLNIYYTDGGQGFVVTESGFPAFRRGGIKWKYDLSKQPISDIEFRVKDWARLVLEDPIPNHQLLFTAARGILRAPSEWSSGLLPYYWEEFRLRSGWFVEVYRELFKNDLRLGLMPLVDGGTKTRLAASRLMAILQIHDFFGRSQHLEILSIVAEREFSQDRHIFSRNHYNAVLLDWTLTLHEQGCRQLLFKPRSVSNPVDIDMCMMTFKDLITRRTTMKVGLLFALFCHRDKYIRTAFKKLTLMEPPRYLRLSRHCRIILPPRLSRIRNLNSFRLDCILDLEDRIREDPIVLQTVEELAHGYLIMSSLMSGDGYHDSDAAMYYKEERKTVAEILCDCVAIKRVYFPQLNSLCFSDDH